MSSKTVERRTGGRSARVVDAVLRTTLDMFAEAGWDGVQIDAVAARAGVHKTTVYRRWPTRGALVAAALEATPFRTYRVIDGNPPNSGSLRGDLETSMATVREALAEERTWSIVRNLHAAATVPEVSEASRSFWESRTTWSTVVFERAKKRGEIARSADVDVLAALWTGAIKLTIFDFGIRPTRTWCKHLIAATLRAAQG